MEERVNCINCGASILTQTATRTGGICKPCFNQDLQAAIAETPFGRAYETSYQQPKFYSKNEACYSWFDIWQYMELKLAGLLFSLRYSGNCDWVFRDRGAKFLKLRNAEHFKEWCLTVLERTRTKAHELSVDTIEAQQDRATILRKADEMQRTVELAYEMVKQREVEKAKPHV